MKRPIIITISGKAEHGKDAFASDALEIIVDRFGMSPLIVRFGDYLKFVLKEYFRWDGKKDAAGRSMLQDIGEGMKRKDKNIFADVVSNLVQSLSGIFNVFLVPDARFPFEIDRLKDVGDVITVYVERIGFENSLTPAQRSNISETTLDDYPFDYGFKIEEGRQNVRKCVFDFLSRVF